MEALYFDMNMRVIGWVYADDDRIIASGVYQMRGKDWIDRLLDLENWLATKTQMAHLVGYEVPTGDNRNMQTNRRMGAAEYVVCRFARQAGLRLVSVVATEVKTGPCKNNLYLAVQIKGGPLDDDYPGDEADALGVFIACQKKIKLERLAKASR